tara:strand:+ start:154 stop:663 length:510 start_codon:yes stop_codon:yes gene_type:complete
MTKDNQVCVGKITAPHGIRGQVKIHSYTQNPEDLMAYGWVFDDKKQSYDITIHRVKGSVLIASVDGIDTRNDAEKLRHTVLYIDRDQLPDIEKEDDFYIDDLVGLEVRCHESEEVVGVVKTVVNYGASDIVCFIRSDNSKEEMQPFTRHIFPHINIDQGYITYVAPEVE